MQKENLGKLYLSNMLELYIVCGYDYIAENYILYKLKDDDFWKYLDSYKELKQKDEYKLINRDGLIDKFKEFEKEAFELDEKLSLFDKYNDKYGKLYEFYNMFHRYKETSKNIESLNYIINIFNKHPERYLDDLIFYKKELKKHEKGLRRINKRIYSYFKNDTDYIINLIEEDASKDIHHILYKRDKLFKDIEILDKHLNNLDNYLKKHKKEGLI